jgi:hypothetical protein
VKYKGTNTYTREGVLREDQERQRWGLRNESLNHRLDQMRCIHYSQCN